MASAAAVRISLVACAMQRAVLGMRTEADLDEVDVKQPEGLSWVSPEDLKEAEEFAAEIYARRAARENGTALLEQGGLEADAKWRDGGTFHAFFSADQCKKSRAPACLAYNMIDMSVQRCATMESMPWENVIEKHGEQTWSEIAKQLKVRLQNPMATLDQQQEGFCGTVGYVFIMALAMPIAYTEMVLNLLCTGKSNLIDANPHNLGDKIRNMLNVDTAALITKAPLKERKISAVDWITLASIRESAWDYNFRPWATAAKKDSQGTGWWAHAGGYQAMLFDIREPQDLLHYAGEPNPLKDELFAPVKEAAKEDYTLLVISIHVAQEEKLQKFITAENRGFSNHIAVLVGVVNGKTARDDMCITWTWADLYKIQCARLQQIVVDVGKIDMQEVMKNHYNKAGFDLERVKHLKSILPYGVRSMSMLFGVVGAEFNDEAQVVG